MRKTTILLLALVLGVVVQAHALSVSQTMGYQRTSIRDRLPIAVVMNDDMWYSTDRNTYYSTENQNLGRIWRLLKEQGQEVHFYTSSFFRPPSGATKADSQYVYELWRNMGSHYAVCYVLGMRGVYSVDPSHTRRFVVPDSTNVQLIVCGAPAMLSDYPAGGPTLRVGTALQTITNITANAATGSGDGTNLAFTTASTDTFYCKNAMVSAVAYSYPNHPYPAITVAGSVAAATGRFTADAGTPFASMGHYGRATVSAAGTGTITGELWCEVISSTIVRFRTVTNAIAGAANITDGTCTLNFWPSDNTMQHIAKTVQLFKPYSGGSTWPISSTKNFRADSCDVIYADTVCTYANEALPIAYRVYWDSPATNGNYCSWLTSQSESRHTDFVLFTGTVSALTPYYAGEIMYALGSRYAKCDPIKVAYEWDDHGTFGFDDADSTGSNYQPQWPYADSLARFRSYLLSKGVPPTFNTTGPPDSLYNMGATTQTGYAGRQLKYDNLMTAPWTFVAHNHDTTGARPLSIVLGTGSHQAAHASPNICYDHRVAFGLNATPPAKYGTANFASWGIYQRLKMNDSLYTLKFGPGHTAPYLSFPNNFSAPIDMRVGQKWGAVAAGVVSTGDIPPDSLFAAFALSGKRFVRGYVWAQQPYRIAAGTTPLLPTYAYLGESDTSMFVQTWFANSDQVYYGQIPSGWGTGNANQPGTGKYQVRCIGAVAVTGAVARQTPLAAPAAAVFARPAELGVSNLLGATNHVTGTYNTQDQFGEAAYGTASPAFFTRSVDIGRFRMAYQHPVEAQWTIPSVYNGINTEWWRAVCGIFAPIDALNTLAGHKIVQWVNPWNLYAAGGQAACGTCP